MPLLKIQFEMKWRPQVFKKNNDWNLMKQVPALTLNVSRKSLCFNDELSTNGLVFYDFFDFEWTPSDHLILMAINSLF